MKILLGCPTSEHKAYCLDQYITSIKSLTYPNYDILLIDNSQTKDYYKKIRSYNIPVIKDKYQEYARDRIIHSRNILRKQVLDNNYDYLFSLEQDVIPPKDILERLLSHKKQVISGIYFAHNLLPNTGNTELIPLVYILKDKKTLTMRTLTDDELWNPQLLKIVSCGLGCVLMHKDILKKIKIRYDKNFESFDDRWFGLDCYNNNFEMFCDNTVKCKHLIYNRIPWSSIKK